MGLWQRTKTLFKAKANKTLSSMEKPDEILEQAILDMKKAFVESKKQVARAMADEKRLRRQLDEEQRLSKEWEDKAMLAVKAGKEDLARQALARKAEHDTSAAEYEKQWTGQKAMTDKLRGQLKELDSKIDGANRKKNLLIARQKRAEAQKSIQETMSGMSDTSAFDVFDKMENKVNEIESETEANAELSGDFEGGDDLSKQFGELEAANASASQDDALAALKAKMSKS